MRMVFSRVVLLCLLASGLLLTGSGCESETAEGNWADGEKVGEWVYRYPDGQLEKQGTYQAGVPEGEWTYWHENGQRKEAGSYREGKKHGLWTVWAESGQPIERGEYQQGTEHGTWVKWHENGQRAEEAEYRFGQRFGPWTRWDEDGNAETRFAFQGTSPEVQQAIDDLTSSDPAKVKAAEERILADTTEAIVALGTVIKQGRSTELELAANRLLVKLGPQAEPLLQFVVDNLKDSNTAVRAGSISVLRSMGEVGYKAALERLDSTEADIRTGSCLVLGGFPDHAEEAVPRLYRLVTSDSNQQVRYVAAKAMTELGELGIKPLGTMARTHNEPSMRVLALSALGESENNAAFDALLSAMNDNNRRNDQVRNALLAAMSNFPDYGPGQLIQIYDEQKMQSSSAQKELARLALIAIGKPAVDDLVEALMHESVQVRFNAAYTLQQMGEVAEQALPALRKVAASDPEAEVRTYARNAIDAIESAL